MSNMPQSARAGRMTQSEIRRIFNLSLTMKDAVHLEMGEPDFPTPTHIMEAAAEGARQGWTKYGPSLGHPDLRAAIAKKAREYNSIVCDPNSEILVTHGGMGALSTVFLTLVDEGNEVLVPDPGWTNYVGHVRLAGARPVLVRIHEEDGFAMDPDAVRRAITSKTRALMLNNPSNPTGGVTPREQLIEIAKICAEAGVYLISDEVYEALIFEGQHFSPGSLPETADWVITINSFSKTYSMTGWRVGYAIAKEATIKAMTKIQEHLVASVSAVSQRAALAALTSSQQCVRDMAAEYKRRRDIIVDGFNSIPGFSCQKSPATFYAFPNIKAFGMPSLDFAMTILEKAHVALVPGGAFGPGGEGYLRVSFASSEGSIREALSRISRLVSQGVIKPGA